MDNLGQWVVDQLIAETKIERVIAIYPGRFQPMGRHHAETFKWVQEQFGEENSFIATTNKTELPKSPFSFDEKKQIIESYGITNVVEVKNAYVAKEITEQFDPENTAVVFIVGKKDMDENPRIKIGKKKNGDPTYFQNMTESLQSLDKHGYIVEAPHVALVLDEMGIMSGTSIRKSLGEVNEKKAGKLFEDIFGHKDPEVFGLVMAKLGDLNEFIGDFVVKSDVVTLLKEVSSMSAASAIDDGPRYFYGNQKTYRKKTQDMAQKLGFDVVNYIMGDEQFEVHDTRYPEGPVGTVSYFPVGKAGKEKAGTNQLVDMVGMEAYLKWEAHIKSVAELVGFKLINYLGAAAAIELSVNEPEGLMEMTFKEGGSSGHMLHPYENNDLSFNDLKEIVTLGLSGKLGPLHEKTDGQNLKVTWKDGKLKAARNKTTLQDPMTITEVAKKFDGRGAIKDAFHFAMRDLSKAMKDVPSELKEEIFGNGKRFLNLEIIYPGTENVIHYNRSILQFHNVNEYNEGELVGYLENAETVLFEAITNKKGKVFEIIGPNEIKVKKDEKHIKYFQDKLDEICKKVGSSTIKDYKFNCVKAILNNHEWTHHSHMTQESVDGLARRVAFQDKSFRLNGKTIADKHSLAEAKAFDKNAKKLYKEITKPLESVILEFGTKVLSNATNHIAENTTTTKEILENKVQDTILEITSNHLDMVDKLEVQMERYTDSGDTVNPIEGVVFEYKGHTMKLTGGFAPINQMLGFLKFSK